MNLGEAERLWRRSSTDTVAAKYLWSREDFAGWYSEAEVEAAVRANLIFDDWSSLTELSLVAGERRIAIDPSIHEIRKLWLIDSAGRISYADQVTRPELDCIDPRWRERTASPRRFIQDDKSITFDRLADAAYQVRMEVFRGPLKPMRNADDRPEIAAEHHRHLLEWVDYRAYSIPDADTENGGKSAAAFVAFEARFGRRPEAGYVRRKASNRPHRVKAWP